MTITCIASRNSIDPTSVKPKDLTFSTCRPPDCRGNNIFGFKIRIHQTVAWRSNWWQTSLIPELACKYSMLRKWLRVCVTRAALYLRRADKGRWYSTKPKCHFMCSLQWPTQNARRAVSIQTTKPILVTFNGQTYTEGSRTNFLLAAVSPVLLYLTSSSYWT